MTHTPGASGRRRAGWPWTSVVACGVQDGATLAADAVAAVIREAAVVAALSRDLGEAVARLQEARLELGVATDADSLEEARRVVEAARRREARD